jgi:hypothetical protein
VLGCYGTDFEGQLEGRSQVVVADNFVGID